MTNYPQELSMLNVQLMASQQQARSQKHQLNQLHCISTAAIQANKLVIRQRKQTKAAHNDNNNNKYSIPKLVSSNNLK